MRKYSEGAAFQPEGGEGAVEVALMGLAGVVAAAKREPELEETEVGLGELGKLIQQLKLNLK